MEIETNAIINSKEINDLMDLCWDKPSDLDYAPILNHNLAHFSAHKNNQLIAFCNLAWDGGRHATIFDLNVHPDYRRKGLALEIMKKAKQIADENKIQFLHVDFDVKLQPLYEKAGFEIIKAGIIYL